MFPFGGKKKFTPADLDLDLWIRADDVTIISGKVSQANDKSGNNNHPTQSNASLRPVINATGIGGKPTFTLTRTSATAGTFLESSTSIGSAGGRMTVIAVIKPRLVNGYSGGVIFTSRKDANSLAHGITTKSADPGYYVHQSHTAFYVESANAVPAAALPDLGGVSAVVDMSVDRQSDTRWPKLSYQGVPYVNSLPIQAKGLGPDSGAAGYLIGCYATGATSIMGFYDGEIAELIVKAGPITWNNRRRLNTYFNERYGIAVDNRIRFSSYGDSNTVGFGSPETLATGGYRVEFAANKNMIGTGTTAQPTLHKHNGYSAQGSIYFDTNVSNYYSDDPAELLLMQFTYNDPELSGGTITAEQSVTNTISVINKCKAINPEVKIVVLGPPNARSDQTSRNAGTAAIRALFPAALAGIANVVYVAPSFHADSNFITGDGIHYNAIGHSLICSDMERGAAALGF